MMKTNQFLCRPALAGTLLLTISLAGCGLTGISSPVTVSDEFAEGATQVKASAEPNFTVKSEGYALWLPAKPQTSTQEAGAPGTEKFAVQVAAASSGPISYVVVPVPVPGGRGDSDAGDFIESLVEGYIKSAQGKLTKTTNLMLGQHAGRQIEYTFGGTSPMAGNHGITRFYYTGPYAYQISAIGPKSALETKKVEVHKVLNSFRVLETE